MVKSGGAPMFSDEKGMLRASLDAVPALVFVVDEDVRIIDCNAAASRLLEVDKTDALFHRAGDVLHCLHSTDHEEGCGRGPFCRNCIIRNSVGRALSGQSTLRRRARMDLLSDNGIEEINALITVTSYAHEGQQLALLVIEDIRPFADFLEILGICSRCKKVREQSQDWVALESFFKQVWDMDFSHGFCPECAEVEFAALETDRYPDPSSA